MSCQGQLPQLTISLTCSSHINNFQSLFWRTQLEREPHFSKIFPQWHLKRDGKNMPKKCKSCWSPQNWLHPPFFLKVAELLSDWMANVILCHAVESKCRQKAAHKSSSTHEWLTGKKCDWFSAVVGVDYWHPQRDGHRRGGFPMNQ